MGFWTSGSEANIVAENPGGSFRAATDSFGESRTPEIAAFDGRLPGLV